MVVALSVLAMGEEALRDHQMEIVLGARHCDIEEPPLLLNLFRSAGAEVRWNTSIDDIQHEDRLPFLALGGMDGRKDQIILIEQRQAGLIAGRIRRIELSGVLSRFLVGDVRLRSNSNIANVIAQAVTLQIQFLQYCLPR